LCDTVVHFVFLCSWLLLPSCSVCFMDYFIHTFSSSLSLLACRLWLSSIAHKTLKFELVVVSLVSLICMSVDILQLQYHLHTYTADIKF